MNRLTRRKADGTIVFAPLRAGQCVDVVDLVNTYGNRLADYEETDLTVEQIKSLQEKQEREWIKFETETDKEAGREILTCPIPDDEQEILITDGKNVWLDTFCNDGCECYFDSGFDFDKITHWKPLPKPPEESEEK